MGKCVRLCDACGRREAFFFRSYSGVSLCRKCFAVSIEEKTRTTIDRYKMFRFDDRIAVAVSGGKDSVSLLHVLARIEAKHPKAELLAVTVDEGIKGYRKEALEIAARNCKKLGVEHQVVSFKKHFGFTLDFILKQFRETKDLRLTPCSVCGVLRRKLLNLAAREIGATKLTTAHTLDDETQTILLNILHGDVLRLAKEKPVTDEAHPKLVPRAKPFCEIPERETALYAYVKEVEFQSSRCPYASEALRNDARMILNTMEERHPGMKFTVFKSIEKIRPALEQTATKAGMRECSECGEPTTENTCRTCQLLESID